MMEINKKNKNNYCHNRELKQVNLKREVEHSIIKSVGEHIYNNYVITCRNLCKILFTLGGACNTPRTQMSQNIIY